MPVTRHGSLRAAHLIFASTTAVLSFAACSMDADAPVEASTEADEALATCSREVMTHSYKGAPDYWGTLKVKNTGSKALNRPRVAFDVPSGVTCDYHESGWTHSQRGSTCVYASTSDRAVAPGASFTVHFSTNSQRDFTPSDVKLRDSSCGGGASGGGASGGGDSGAGWRTASLTTFTSYPDPGSEECIDYSGCEWAGQFAAVDDKKSESWVRQHNIVAVHSKDFDEYKLKTLRLRKNGKEIDVKVYDECADSDCSGCCTRNARPSGYLIDVEKYTLQRFGVEADGQVEWRCLDCD